MKIFQEIPGKELTWEITHIKSGLRLKSKGKRKRGGGRIITFIVSDNKEIYLLIIYDKSEIDSIDDTILSKLIEEIKYTL